MDSVAVAELGAPIKLELQEQASDCELVKRSARKNRKRDAMENPEEGSLDDTPDGGPRKRRRQDDLKKKHNLTSQKGRQKINEAITLLKRSCPELDGVECNKAVVLQCAVTSLERLRSEVSLLTKQKEQVEQSHASQAAVIASLLFELNSMRNAAGLPALHHELIHRQDPSAVRGACASNPSLSSTTAGSVSSPNSDACSTTDSESTLPDGFHHQQPHHHMSLSQHHEVHQTDHEQTHHHHNHHHPHHHPLFLAAESEQPHHHPAAVTDVNGDHSQLPSSSHATTVYDYYQHHLTTATPATITTDECQFNSNAHHLFGLQDFYGKPGCDYNGQFSSHLDHNPSICSHPPIGQVSHHHQHHGLGSVTTDSLSSGGGVASQNNSSMPMSTVFNLGLFSVLLVIFPVYLITQGFEGGSLSFVGSTRQLASSAVPSIEDSVNLSYFYFHRSSSFWSGVIILVLMGALVAAAWYSVRKWPLFVQHSTNNWLLRMNLDEDDAAAEKLVLDDAAVPASSGSAVALAAN